MSSGNAPVIGTVLDIWCPIRLTFIFKWSMSVRDNSEILSMDNFLQIVKEHLPQAGTELSIYTFLASDDLWLGKLKSQRSFVTVAD